MNSLAVPLRNLFRPGLALRTAAVGFLLLAALIAGCTQEPQAAPIDPAKAPWFDPAKQAEALSHADMRIRAVAAYNLGNLGAKAAAALPQLEKLAAGDPEPKVRERAVEAAQKIRAAMGDGAPSQ